MKEADISRLIQIELSKHGARLFRNNVGLFKTLDGRKIRTGLCPGSSDLIGWTKEGKFLAVEVKAKGGRSKKTHLEEQTNFINKVLCAGGVAFFATSPEEAVEKLNAIHR